MYVIGAVIFGCIDGLTFRRTCKSAALERLEWTLVLLLGLAKGAVYSYLQKGWHLIQFSTNVTVRELNPRLACH